MGVEWCNSRRGHTNLIEEKTLALSNPQPPTFKSNAMFTTKGFANNKVNVFVYGNDITNSSLVESANQLLLYYPRQIGRMFGVGVTFKL